MSETKLLPIYESAVKLLETLVTDLKEKDTRFTAELRDDIGKLTPIETMMLLLSRTDLPQEHLPEVIDRLRALIGSADRVPFLHFALLGLAAELERRIVPPEPPPAPAA